MTHPINPYSKILLSRKRPLLPACVMITLLLTLLACAAQPDDNTVTIGAEGGALSLANGAQVTLPPEGISGEVQLRAETIPAAEFHKLPAGSPLSAAAEQLPSYLTLRSDVYHFAADGAQPANAWFSLPLSGEAGLVHPFDLYGWDAAGGWRWLPTRYEPEAARVSSQLDVLPAAIALAESEPVIPLVSTGWRADTPPPANSEGALSELLLEVTVENDGRLAGATETDPPQTTAQVVPSLRNWRPDGSLSADLAGLLADPARRQRHVEMIVGLAMSGGYPAIQLDYWLDASQRAAFSAFVTDLAAALHQQNRSLIVRVEEPRPLSATEWDSGAYDLLSIGQAADRVQLPLPIEPGALAEGQIESLLNWAVSQVERTKLQPALVLVGVGTAGGQVTRFQAGLLLVQTDTIQLAGRGQRVSPGSRVTFLLPARLVEMQPEIDPVTGMLHLTLSEPARSVYFPTAASLSRWLERLAGYRLAGVVIDQPLDTAGRGTLWPVLRAYRSGAPLPAMDEPLWLWTISGPAGEVSRDTRPLPAADYEGEIPAGPGEVLIEVGLSLDGGQTAFQVSSVSLAIETPRPTATPTRLARPTATPTPRPAPTLTPTPVRVVAPPPTATPLPSNNCPDSRAAITNPVNGSTIRGVVPFMGTAYLDNLKAYKFEYKPAGAPTWQFLVQFDYTWVTDDKLMDFYTSTVAPGVYDFRLIVVDMSGNYPPPCEIQVTVAR